MSKGRNNHDIGLSGKQIMGLTDLNIMEGASRVSGLETLLPTLLHRES